ncbi:MAG: transporter substrate-binding domain-containing protein [Bacteroidota bacterium]|nr:transporter substrate-binding domain-containing protein [Bacteroidota bacterium]
MFNIRNLVLVLLTLVVSVVFESCGNSNDEESGSELNGDAGVRLKKKTLEEIFSSSSSAKRDLKEIKESGTLYAVTMYSSTSYFLYRGHTMGFEYELLERIAKHLDVELQIVIAKDIFEMVEKLHEGKADIIAHGLAVTRLRKEYVNFTDELFLSHQVLVQRKPENWRQMKLHEIQESLISDNIELVGKTVSVRLNSSYFHRLNNLMEEIGDEIYIDTMPGDLETEKLIRMVVDGQIKFTVADNNIASINASYYPELDIKVPMSFSQRIAWSVRKSSPDLVSAINRWLTEIKSTADFNVIYDKYFENKRDFRKRIKDDYFSSTSGKISQYDPLIKKYSKDLDWDWRLVSSLVYQESQFDPQAKSWAGAQGLMQLMPATARELGVNDRANPEENIKGGTKYLKYLWDKWEDINDSTQRIKFVMASFNCGYYHVKDATNLAEKHQHDKSKWDDNVELYILKLSNPEFFNDPVVHHGYARGIEPFTYVYEIFERFDHYRKFVAD